jgi:acetyl esterase/lipase
MFKTFFSIILTLFLICPAFSRHYKIFKDLDYVKSSEGDYDAVEHKLDIYSPDASLSCGKILVFIHGGSWETGHKETYKFLGKAFASNGFVVVIINYRLSPVARYDGMAYDCARAVTWVKEHAVEYGGRPDEIFVSGHSAGGHLAALIAGDDSYFEKAGIGNPIKGVILNDAFGLNIFKYLDHGHKGDAGFRVTFNNNPQGWKKASPFFYIKKNTIRYYILYGGKTYPVIISDSKEFHAKNLEVENSSEISIVRRKRHIGMVLIFFSKRNKEVKKVIAFIKK